jgi:isopenicillin-N epimerase
MPPGFKADFLLDPDIVFLNHGSFGACPRPVFEEYQRWQRELERNPVSFLGRRCSELMANARAELGAFLGVPGKDVVYFPNPTTAANMIARSLRLEPGDEILTTDHEYGAMVRTWRFNAQKSGFKYVAHPMPLPLTTPEAFVENFWAGVTERTKVIFISHITSSTALIFPVQAICQRARAAGILTIVDGAHAPSQIPLNVLEVGADLYIGACHKWLCAPKGSAFLYARPEVQDWLMPLVVSWGYDSDLPTESQFISYHEWQGTRDVAAFLATPAAIRYQAQHDWDAVRAECHALLSDTHRRLHALTDQEPVCPDSTDWYSQMAVVSLPPLDHETLFHQLRERYRIVMPITQRNGRNFARISCQAYNTQEDMDTLVKAMEELVPAARMPLA